MSLHPSVAIRGPDNLEGDILSEDGGKQNITITLCVQGSSCTPLESHSHVLLDLSVIKAPANQPLGGVQRVLRVCDSLALSRHAHQSLPLRCEGHD